MSLLILGFLAVLPYLRAVHGEFLFDDPILFEDNQTPGVHYRHVAFFHAHTRSMVHCIDELLWRAFGRGSGMDATQTVILQPSWPWHLASLAFHVGNTLLVQALTQMFLDPTRAFLAAAIFAVHPLQVSAVSYISARAGMQAAFFSFLGLLHASMGGWHWSLAVLSQYFAYKSKQDGLLYLMLYPVVLYYGKRF